MTRLSPRLGDNTKPLVSVAIHCEKYEPNLQQCLESVFAQTYDNIEVIFFDSSLSGHPWTIASEFAERFPGTITLGRRQPRADEMVHGHHQHHHPQKRNPFRTAAKGMFVLDLNPGDVIGADFVSQYVSSKQSEFLSERIPLVSVLIYNYNYGRYLRQCLDSVFNQSYENFVVVFSDNHSTDESWSIASEFAERHPGRMTIMRNRRNMGPQFNSDNCYRVVEGKYFMLLCSDDALAPGYLEQCVHTMESHRTAKFCITHRQIIDDQGAVKEEPPFYNQSCIIPGNEQAAVYMMAAVNPSLSQVLYNRELALESAPGRGLIERWLSYRILDFNLCLKSDLAYIKEPLLLHRVHASSDTSAIDHSLIEILTQFIFVHQCAEVASANDFIKAAQRLPQATDKLGGLSARYCVRMLLEGDLLAARRYYHLALAINPEVEREEAFRIIQAFWTAGESDRAKILDALGAQAGLTQRTVSYDPPPGSVPIAPKKMLARCQT